MTVPAPAEEEQRRPMSKMRRAIVASMTLSAQIPQFTLDRWVELDRVATVRDQLRESGVKVSWEDILVAACARALREHRNVNASFDDDAIVEHAQINVGIATALADGLVSPAIVGADRLGFASLVSERMRLRAGAAAGRLRGVELFGATFSVSNLGPFGIDRFRALVIPPQAAILATGRLHERDGVSGMMLSLSCDHRVLDGAPAARFLATVSELLQTPDWCLQLGDGETSTVATG
jgi:pyruvate/2-oxoglutarate dehydrogenase complex dihydrolipoamide acyltransferase (E2) component